MLTADLSQSWYRNGRTGPRYIDTSGAGYLRDAETLISIFAAHEGRERVELDAALAEYVGTGTDYKIMRGLIKLLSDRCRFETATVVEPLDIRRALFLKAREFHPLRPEDALARTEIFAQVALALNCAPVDLLAGLYADLPEKQRLIEFESLSARELLDLYNLAQAQALLYRCVEMRLRVEPQGPEGYRELFGAIKAYRLIHSIKGSAADGYEIRLDGPVSMFHRSQKYGIQMAVFLPALLLATGWRMRAEIASKPGAGGGASAFFEMESEGHQLRSSYVSSISSSNGMLERLSERWAEFDSPWTLEPSSRVIDLGESAFIPDFVIRHADGQEFYLEVLGFWTPRHLQERLREFEHYGQRNFLIAASDELRGSRDPLARIPPHVIVFKKNLEPVAVELAIEKLLTGVET